MKKAHHDCNEELIGRYLDGEVSQEEHDGISRHLKDCLSCQKILEDNQSISTVFRDTLKIESSHAGFAVLKTRVLDQIRQKENPWWKRLAKRFSSIRILIPATALAALVLFFAIPRSPTTISDPSAIVEAFSGDVSSVMIIETPKSRQTIIWYKETS